jgi:hypothetical protein
MVRVRSRRTLQQAKLLWVLCFGFVSGHDFSRAVKKREKIGLLAPAMVHSARIFLGKEFWAEKKRRG